ncbi:MAG: four helix bundle protein [Candidatus Sumerlaeaceae bacterium]
MEAENLKKRTKQFALRVIRLVEALPQTRSAEIIGRQVLRCGTSVGANYRASCRAKSQADFIAKMAIVEEEGDECLYWMELLEESEIVAEHLLRDLKKEANELIAITVASIRTAKQRKDAPRI